MTVKKVYECEDILKTDDTGALSCIEEVDRNKIYQSSSYPVELGRAFAYFYHKSARTSLIENAKYYLYNNIIYLCTGNDTEEQRKLLIMDLYDSDRRKFERLKNKFSNSNKTIERKKIPENVRVEVWRRDQGRCVQCGSREKLEYDHIIPVSKGGSNTARNIELLCEECNRNKGDKIQ